jgi:hypothetical protein
MWGEGMCRWKVTLLVTLVLSFAPASAETDMILYSPGFDCIQPVSGPMGVWGDIPVFAKVEISPNGNKRWNGTPVSEKDFTSYIEDIARDDPQPVIVVMAQPGTTVATLLPVLELLQRAGVRKVKIADIRS